MLLLNRLHFLLNISVLMRSIANKFVKYHTLKSCWCMFVNENMIHFNQLPCDLSDKICNMARDAWIIDLVEDLYELTQHGYERTGSQEVLVDVETDD